MWSRAWPAASGAMERSMIRGTGGGFEPLEGVGSPLSIRNAIVVG